MMNRNEFDKLDINKQVEYLNSLLNGSNFSFKGVSNNMGIPNSTLRSRLKINGFKYNPNERKIVLIKNDEKSIKDNKKNTFVCDDEIKKKLDEMYSWYKKQITRSEPLIINPNDFSEDTTSKTFKIYNNVLKELEDFCYKNRQYSVQAIVNTAILNLIKQYI